jgi:hypothetical protein
MAKDIKATEQLERAMATEFHHRLRFRVPDGCREVECEVRLMPREAWDEIDARTERADLVWSTEVLDNGMVLAVRGHDHREEIRPQSELFPERAQALRRLRSIIMDALDQHDDELGFMSCAIGAGGTAEFSVALKGIRYHPAAAKVFILEDDDV